MRGCTSLAEQLEVERIPASARLQGHPAQHPNSWGEAGRKDDLKDLNLA